METKKKNILGIIGCVISFIALVAAFLSPQIAEAIDPPAKPVEESVADFAVKLKDAAVAKMNGEEYQATPEKRKPSAALFPAIIGLGMVGTGLGLGSLLRGERKFVSGTAMTLGITAATVQLSILIAAAIIFCLLVLAAFAALGIEIPTP